MARRRPEPPPESTPDRATTLAAIYGRVSTAGQVDGTSLGTQVATCRAEVTRHGWGVADEYIDAGQSGAKASRPELDRMLADAEARRFQALLVARLDRLGRSLGHLLTLVERMRSLGVRIIFVSEGLDSDREAIWGLMVGILGTIAAWERELIRSRSMAGLQARVTEGGFVGSSPPFGYRVVPDPRGRGVVLAVEQSEAATIRAIYQLLVVKAFGISAAATELNHAGHLARDGRWTAGALSTWAHRDGPVTAAGEWSWGGIAVPVEPILSRSQAAEWRAWTDATTRRSTSRGPYALSGLITMPCGKPAMGRTAGKQAPIYVCAGRYKNRNPKGVCSCRSIRVDMLNAAIWEVVTDSLTRPNAIDTLALCLRGAGPAPDAAAAIAEAAERLEAVRTNLADAYRDAVDAGFSAATARSMCQVHADEVRAAEADLNRLERMRMAARRSSARGESLADIVTRVRHTLAEPVPEVVRDVLEVLDVRVAVTSFERCTTCHGKGCLSLPPGSGRRWPPICPACQRMKVLPVVEVMSSMLGQFGSGSERIAPSGATA